MTTLSNSIFELQFSPENGTFSIFTKDEKLPDIRNARLGVRYILNGQNRFELMSMWSEYQELRIPFVHADQGAVDGVTYVIPGGQDGIGFELTFGIMQEYPLVMWNVKVLNCSSVPINIEEIVLLQVDSRSPDSQVVLQQAKTPSQMGFFSSGWQSWSPTGWHAGDGKMPQTRLGGLQAPMIYNDGTPLPKGIGQFSSDFFGVIGDRVSRTGFVVGFLSQKNHFGWVSADFNNGVSLKLSANGDDARLDPGCSMVTDWAVFNPVLLDHRDPLDKYLEAVTRENHVRVPEDSPVGWCSWYHFYTKISNQIIQDNLKSILDRQETLPVQLVQIDDGFESQIGDWFTFKPEFPEGVKPLAEEITREGLLPGLWLAPFIVHPKSELMKQHPDWILRKANGKPVNAGYVWEALDTALDLTVPEALDYACRVVKTASQDWHFPYLKLDFLYAAALPGKYKDPTLTRAQVLRKGMKAIRAAVGPEVTLLGCGAPLGSMLGLVEAMRIGADVSGDWYPKFNGIGAFIKNEPSMPCARNSVRNILTRANLHKHWWINDPDCLLIRPDSHLSLAEVQSLASVIALTGGSLLISDDLPNLTADRLRIAECLLPVIGDRARVVDWFDAEMPSMLRLDLVNETGEWHLLAKFNWTDQAADLALDLKEFQLSGGSYHFREFWSGQVGELADENPAIFQKVPPHGGVVAAVRRIEKDAPAYLGSDLHISQGLEVSGWQFDERSVQIKLRLPRKAQGSIQLAVPGGVESVAVSGHPVQWQTHSEKIFSIPVEVDGFAEIEITRK